MRSTSPPCCRSFLTVLGYEQQVDEDLLDPDLQGQPFWFWQMEAPRLQRNRIHPDPYLPAD